MRRLLCLVLALLMILPAAALSEEDIEIEEITDNPEAQENGGPVWHFPVALEDMNPDFVKIANKHYLLDKSFVCKPLVKIKSLKLEKDKVTRKSGDMYVVSGGMELNETCAAALAALSDAARADGQILYLKSAYRSFQTQ